MAAGIFTSVPLQASQLGLYRAFVDNYTVAVETAERCCQANTQFAEISEVTAGRSVGRNRPLGLAGWGWGNAALTAGWSGWDL